MQSPMFVFAGLHREPIENLTILLVNLNKIFVEQQLSLSFTRKDKLLTSRYEDVSFYISIFDDEKEVKDWYQMAKDFELTQKPNPLNNDDFMSRLKQKKTQSPQLYEDVHYLIGKIIYSEMNKLAPLKIYFFL